jgi:hypothetical protein
MNKKILFLILFLVVLALPAVSSAADIKSIITAIKTGLTGLGGGLATIGFIVAGITYIASTANPSLMATAKTALVAAVIGIVIVLLAGTACGFINTLTGAGGDCGFINSVRSIC